MGRGGISIIFFQAVWLIKVIQISKKSNLNIANLTNSVVFVNIVALTICGGCEGCGQRSIIIRTWFWSSTLNIYSELYVCPLPVKSNFHCHKSTNVTKVLNIFGGRSSEGVQCGQMEYNNQKIVP